jgi:hypothetical protein
VWWRLWVYRALRLNQPEDEAFALMPDMRTPNPTWAAFINAMPANYRT